ncbi:DUF1847 domain-containing protein [Anaerotruncus rubiinfantis]|nr:DUF1847 domain-containing protein [Anaerotruncus rubiinfantis]
MYTCAECAVHACNEENRDNLPKNCPMRREDGFFAETFREYEKPEQHEFYIKASEIEAIGYGQWTRMQEIMEFCRNMGYQKLGLAFCRGLRWEAKVISRVLRQNGFTVVSVICKTGGIPKEQAGIVQKLGEGFEPMCNPIAQAALLNEQKTQLNIVVGLCVGHDSLFYKYSDAMVTTLITKDRVLAHNPAGAVYCAEGYYKKKLTR